MPTILVTGRDAQITARNKEHAEEKITKLAKFFDGIGKIEAILSHSGDVSQVELIIGVRRGNPIVCHSSAKDLYAAIDLVIDKAEAQLTKLKERRKRHKGDPSASGDVPASPLAAAGAGGSDDEGLESYDEVIDKRDFP